MGKRKKSSRGPAKKIVQRLDVLFNCLFCNHERSVSVMMDKKNNIGSLHCKVCGQSFQTRINALSQPVDVYSDWFDAVEEVNEGKHSESEDENSDSDYESDSDAEPIAKRRKAVGSDSDEEEVDGDSDSDEGVDHGRNGTNGTSKSIASLDSADDDDDDDDGDGRIHNKRARATYMDSDDE